MRKAALLYNPVSGGGRRRQSDLEASLALLRSSGVEAELVLTESSAGAAEQAKRGIAAGADTLLACGGDGTIHDVLQGMAGSPAALGVLPMGTANALAHDLGLPMHPVAAARALLDAVPRRVGLGQISYVGFDGRRAANYFTVAAGVGVDAHLFYKLNPSAKNRLGMMAYYAKAWNLWMTHRMRRFQATWTDPASGMARSSSLTELLAVRITNFGGILREFAPGASLLKNEISLLMCHTSSRAAYLSYVARCVLGLSRKVEGIEIIASKTVSCDSNEQSSVYVQADGELLGTLPATITLVPDALTLLVPRDFGSEQTPGRV